MFAIISRTLVATTKIIKITLLPLLLTLATISIVNAAVYRIPSDGSDIIGHIFTAKIKRGESLIALMHHYELSSFELKEANPKVNFYRLRIGQKITIPAMYILPPYRSGIVINIPELRLYYFPNDGSNYVYTYPVALGKKDWRTPIAATKIIKKAKDPTWYVPDSIRDYMFEKHGKLFPDFIPPGPENPLGKYALYLGKRGYVIHGTNQPNSVGLFISSGCIRLLSEPIETLYNLVNVGTSVHIIHHINKAGWYHNTLYLESHLPASQYDDEGALSNMDAETAILEAVSMRPVHVDWGKVQWVINHPNGIPQQIGETLE